MRPVTARRAAGWLLVLLLGMAAFLMPLPLLVLMPGDALPVAERVEFPTEDEDELTGRLLLTTVSVASATAVDALAGWLDPDSQVLSRDRIIPSDTAAEDYFAAQRRLFQESGQTAAAVGLRAAGLPVDVSGRGAQVARVLPGAPAEGKLSAGDVVTSVDGTPVRLAADLVAALAEHPPGRELQLTVERGGRPVPVPVTPTRFSDGTPEGNRSGLGVLVTTRDLRIDLPYPVEVDAGQIGGPSAGLMIALTVYELANPGDLVRGRVIAGTGTIDLDGDVGPVGGVRQKVEAAVDAGAMLFLSPPAEAAEARAAAGTRLRILEVTTLRDALDALRRGDGPGGR